jgi:hypothetical protein
MTVNQLSEVWVFIGGGTFPSGVFSTRELAEAWIEKHQLSGVLTKYPLDEGMWNWAVKNGYFKVNREDQKSSRFIERFASGHEHYHYGNGVTNRRGESEKLNHDRNND